MKRELFTARNLLQTDQKGVLPIGVGFLAWQLEKNPTKAEQLLSIALDNRVQAIWLAFGEDLGRWVKYVRQHGQNASGQDSVKVFVQISTVEETLFALDDLKADVIVAQGGVSDPITRKLG